MSVVHIYSITINKSAPFLLLLYTFSLNSSWYMHSADNIKGSSNSEIIINNEGGPDSNVSNN